MTRGRLLIIVSALICGLMQPVFALTPKSTFSLTQLPGDPDTQITFSGTITPKVKNSVIRIDVKLQKGWSDTKLRTRSNSKGQWVINARATSLPASARYRAAFTIGKKTYLTISKPLIIKEVTQITTPIDQITLAGPGGRIHGADVSRWQHPNDEIGRAHV